MGVWVANKAAAGVERTVWGAIGWRVYGWWQWTRAREALAGPRWTAWWESACICGQRLSGGRRTERFNVENIQTEEVAFVEGVGVLIKRTEGEPETEAKSEKDEARAVSR